MPSFRDLKAAASHLSESASTQSSISELEKSIPESFTLPEVLEQIRDSSTQAGTVPLGRPHLLALLACLRHSDRIRPGPEDNQVRQKLAALVARSIAPLVPPAVAENEDDVDDDDTEQAYNKVVKHCKAVGELGIDIFALLFGGTTPEAQPWITRLDDQVLFTLIAFTGTESAWTTAATASEANRLLEQQFHNSKDPATRNIEEFATETALKGYLRPLFSRSRPSTLTASGRKAEYAADERPRGLPQDDREARPWKYADLRAVPVFAWAVGASVPQLMTKNWPLYTPVLLTLIDDASTPIRVRGLDILNAFLVRLCFGPSSSDLLQSTGLDGVFADAVLPMLLSLPRLTPVAESQQVLAAAYAALFALSKAMAVSGTAAGDDSAQQKRLALLDRIMREGILAGYFHASEYVEIGLLLVQEAGRFVVEMGLSAVKHLKDLIPILAGIMTDPFAAHLEPLVLAAIHTLQVTLTTCWPRMGEEHWRHETTRALMVCFLRFANEEDAGPQRELVQQELAKTAQMLAAAAQSAADISLADEVAPLVATEPALAALFGSGGTTTTTTTTTTANAPPPAASS